MKQENEKQKPAAAFWEQAAAGGVLGELSGKSLRQIGQDILVRCGPVDGQPAQIDERLGEALH